ncbi:natural resistance-associated macrophage protein [Auriculariales sp. MPI-PUGE-AT-0066]|nr:natural resistance-associated macrophage protein [Auriculariales sp. MPI-PUGE-AT-0066]
MSAPALWLREWRSFFPRRWLTPLHTSVAYFDPGNWSVDLEAGSKYGYRLLFIVLLSSLGATLLQTLSCRLGCVTGADLAVHNRLQFGSHPRHPKLYRWLVLVPLYVAAEIGIIATDLAELLGSAIALSLLIGPKFPLWGGVLLTAADVFILLLGLVVVLVIATFTCFIVLIVQVAPHWPSVFRGFLPSEALIQGGAIYTGTSSHSPHALFLGSSLATLDRVKIEVCTPMPACLETIRPVYTRSEIVARAVKRVFAVEKSEDTRPVLTHNEWENSSLMFIRSHLKHAIVDIGDGEEAPAGLFDAHALISRIVGKPAATLFAVALLCAGQSASLTATLAGQVVSEGFINWRYLILTRSIGLIPAAIVAASFGSSGINSLLVGSQVALSFVLPFVAFPLVWFTSSRKVMRKFVDYSNGWIMMFFGYLVCVVVLVANVYAIVSLARG